ncbi:hypothetical protein C8A00DRAFT_38165 [Chaetomidium leptoderma]|uniref:Actin-like ATPase domain-containing protein n=1 Tax=Chaetomidium leptoderma TaxID=669021 RepID=A0AAN6ZT94_9PEZI|nr:hypothetical protein C8A00DRAFT_38165 [Chaetomidium leptoderma]
MAPPFLLSIGVDIGVSGSWGTGISPGEETLSLLKLALLHPDNLQYDHRQYPDRVKAVVDILDKIREAGKTGVMAVAQYISCLWNEAQPHLARLLQYHHLGPGDVDVRFVFGIPAVWDEPTIMRMKEAIRQSRVCIVNGQPLPASTTFIPEPEAAAIAVIPDMAQRHGLEVGQTVMICDCGGGTVDVISYEIACLSPLIVKECVPGEARLLGDVFLKIGLGVLIKEQIEETDLGEDVDKVALQTEIEAAWNKVRDMEWKDLIKATWSLKVHVQRLSGGRQQRVILAGHDILSLLKTITDGILELAQTQVNAVRTHTGRVPDFAVVVGGFGNNDFLMTELRNHFSNRVKLVFTNMDGQLVVKDGAAISGVRGSLAPVNTPGLNGVDHLQLDNAWSHIHIGSRVARCSYGFLDASGATVQVNWFISKGQDVPVDPHAGVMIPKTVFIAATENCVDIFYTPGTMTRQSALNKSPPLSRVCHVRYKPADHLGQPFSLVLAPRVSGRTVQFEILNKGDVDPTEFTIEYC